MRSDKLRDLRARTLGAIDLFGNCANYHQGSIAKAIIKVVRALKALDNMMVGEEEIAVADLREWNMVKTRKLIREMHPTLA